MLGMENIHSVHRFDFRHLAVLTVGVGRTESLKESYRAASWGYFLSAQEVARANGQLTERIVQLDERVRTLEAQNRVLREIAVRPPTIIPAPDITAALQIIMQGIKSVLQPDVVIHEDRQNEQTTSPPSVPLQFIPDIEMDDMPTRGGWYNPSPTTNGNGMFKSGAGNTQPPHAGGIVE